MEWSLAVKALVEHNGAILLLQRRPNDVHAAGKWDIPGGRLNPGEDPFEGLRRETREETKLVIDIKQPLDVQHFTRDDGQAITMIIFHCVTASSMVTLSEEHTAYAWVERKAADERIPQWIKHLV